jgi:hypothetical protein
LRRYLEAEIGPGFRFDGAMREFIASATPAIGTAMTAGDVVDRWYSSRREAARPSEIAPQFELNRFLQDWWAQHPGGSRSEATAAWQSHRSRPRS